MESNRFKSFVAVLVAIVTVLGALTAGLAAKARKMLEERRAGR